MSKNKKNISAMLGIFLSTIMPGLAHAESDFPSEPISIVAVWPAGGAHDVVARLIANQLTEKLPVPVIVNNVTGAAGSTGVRYIENADPDGYTIGIIGMHAISQSFMNPNATRLDNIDPFVYVGSDPGTLAVSQETGIQNLDEYVEALESNPGTMINGNDQQGGNSFVFASSLENGLDLGMVKIPYAGHAPTVTALVSNEIQSATLPLPPVLENHRAGTVKILAIMSEDRHDLLPDVPTFKEEGYDIVANDFYMVVAPAGVPDDRKNLLETMILDVVSGDSFRDKAESFGMSVQPAGEEEAKEALSEQVGDIYPLLLENGLVNDSLKIR